MFAESVNGNLLGMPLPFSFKHLFHEQALIQSSMEMSPAGSLLHVPSPELDQHRNRYFLRVKDQNWHP